METVSFHITAQRYRDHQHDIVNFESLIFFMFEKSLEPNWIQKKKILLDNIDDDVYIILCRDISQILII